MTVPAFSLPSASLLPRAAVLPTLSAPTTLRTRLALARPLRARQPTRACARPPDQPPSDAANAGPDKDDEALQRELSAKVNELFGDRQNVTIDVESSSERANFSVRRARGGLVGRGASVAEASNDAERSAALTVFTSVAVLSVVAGVIFTCLYYSGAVHGSSSASSGRYEMPTYGTSSYIDPYKLLDDERKAADAQ